MYDLLAMHFRALLSSLRDSLHAPTEDLKRDYHTIEGREQADLILTRVIDLLAMIDTADHELSTFLEAVEKAFSGEVSETKKPR